MVAEGVACPVVNGGSVLGAVMIFGANASDVAKKTAETAADFISKRI